MYFRTIIRETLTTIRRNLLRSALTMLGIIVGVGSFICVVAVGNAGTSRVEEQLHNLGDNLIWIEAGSRTRSGVRLGSRGTRSLRLEDEKAIVDQIDTVKSATPNVDERAQVIYQNLNWGTQYRGVTPEYFAIRNWNLRAGAILSQEDVEKNAAVCVLGQTVVANLFGDEEPIGKFIRVKDLPCKVIGELQEKGFSTTGQDQDDFIVMPLTTVQKRIAGITWIDDIFVSAISRQDIPEATKQIIALLRERHHLHPEEDNDFNIRTPEELIRAQLAAAQVFRLLLGMTAGLSLLVGGIGIMNIMLISVTERTREIGTRMAVGATERDIKLQFLSEAVGMSVAGGLLGVVAGVFGAILLQNTVHWQMELSMDTMAIAGLFSASVGIFFGYYPARRASQLDPIEALRYE